MRKVVMVVLAVLLCAVGGKGLKRLGGHCGRSRLLFGGKSLGAERALLEMREATVGEVHRVAVRWFEESGVPDPEDSSRHLLAHAAQLGYRLSDFRFGVKKIVSPAQLRQFADFCSQRIQRRPVQYIIGNWDFYGLTFLCRPPILIPRPETEELVEKVESSLRRRGGRLEPWRILDVGAGSGSIGIALAACLPNAQVTAVDVSAAAVALATENADRLLPPPRRQRYACLLSSFRSYAELHQNQRLPQFDLVVSNPPYIPAREMATLQDEVRCHEDHGALDGGADGMDVIRDLIRLSPDLLSTTGTRELWMEVDPSHPGQLGKQLDGDRSVRVQGFNDLAGNPRFVCARYT